MQLDPAENRFQFHNGSIKSENLYIQAGHVTRFQFHNGSIKSDNTIDIQSSIDNVSIPQWFD